MKTLPMIPQSPILIPSWGINGRSVKGSTRGYILARVAAEERLSGYQRFGISEGVETPEESMGDEEGQGISGGVTAPFVFQTAIKQSILAPLPLMGLMSN